jgi:hypothetical protein
VIDHRDTGSPEALHFRACLDRHHSFNGSDLDLEFIGYAAEILIGEMRISVDGVFSGKRDINDHCLLVIIVGGKRIYGVNAFGCFCATGASVAGGPDSHSQ